MRTIFWNLRQSRIMSLEVWKIPRQHLKGLMVRNIFYFRLLEVIDRNLAKRHNAFLPSAVQGAVYLSHSSSLQYLYEDLVRKDFSGWDVRLLHKRYKRLDSLLPANFTEWQRNYPNLHQHTQAWNQSKNSDLTRNQLAEKYTNKTYREKTHKQVCRPECCISISKHNFHLEVYCVLWGFF